MRAEKLIYRLMMTLGVMFFLAACGFAGEEPPAGEGETLQVVASTTFIGDVVGEIAGDDAEVTVLLEPGQNPHAYQPIPRDVALVSEADIFFVNGFQLEGFLDDLLTGSGSSESVVVVSEGIEPLLVGTHDHQHDHQEDAGHDGEDHAEDGRDHQEDAGHDGEDHGEDGRDHQEDAGHDGEDHAEDGHDHQEEADHEGDDHEGDGHDHQEDAGHEGDDHEDDGHDHDHLGRDPHVWFDPNNVMVWAENTASALAEADPENAAAYHERAEAYIEQLEELDRWIRSRVGTIPPEHRKLVTDHTSFGYFAEEYGFEQVGAVIPAPTTEAETSGQQLAELVDTIRETGVGVIFVSADTDPSLAERIAEDTGAEVVALYFGSLTAGEPAGTYLEFMRSNVETIAAALK
jgi:ABC-type Zn uptake system ZnuABC Zn-binding protein ZnuA